MHRGTMFCITPCITGIVPSGRNGRSVAPRSSLKRWDAKQHSVFGVPIHFMTLVKTGIHPAFKVALCAGVPASAGRCYTAQESNRLKATHQRENLNLRPRGVSRSVG
jgi:hypothetical protein